MIAFISAVVVSMNDFGNVAFVVPGKRLWPSPAARPLGCHAKQDGFLYVGDYIFCAVGEACPSIGLHCPATTHRVA